MKNDPILKLDPKHVEEKINSKEFIEFFQNNQSLVRSAIAKYYAHVNIGFSEELFEIAKWGLMDAYVTYDPSHKVKLTTWAYFKVRARITQYFRTAWDSTATVVNVYEDTEEMDNALKVDAESQEHSSYSDCKALLKKASLTQCEQDAVQNIFGLFGSAQLSQKDYAAKTNKTKQNVSGAISRAMTKMKSVARFVR